MAANEQITRTPNNNGEYSPITFIKFGTKLNILFGKMLSGEFLKILPLAFIISLPPNKIEPVPIKRVKKLK